MMTRNWSETEWRAVIKLTLAGKIDARWSEEVLLTDEEYRSICDAHFKKAIRPLREKFTDNQHTEKISKRMKR